MIVPKYDINQVVFVYVSGKLVERIVDKIRILITEDKFEVGYQFRLKENDFFASMMMDFYTDESEVFRSLDEFIKMQQ